MTISYKKFQKIRRKSNKTHGKQASYAVGCNLATLNLKILPFHHSILSLPSADAILALPTHNNRASYTGILVH